MCLLAAIRSLHFLDSKVPQKTAEKDLEHVSRVFEATFWAGSVGKKLPTFANLSIKVRTVRIIHENVIALVL